MHGEYGVSDICTSALTVVGPKGAQGKLEVELGRDEIEKFRDSSDRLRAVIKEIDLK